MSTVFLSAGDASGELHAAELAEELRRLQPGIRLLGLGGAQMERSGVDLVARQEALAIGGLVEVMRDLGRIARAWRTVVRALRRVRPDLLLLVDSPDFNIPLARRSKRLGIPALYYISPQVWAWRRGRVAKIARRVDRMAVIFPFEREVYGKTSLPVDFVGHPLVDRLRSWSREHDAAGCRGALGIDAQRPLVALLPGSRRNELRTNLPLQLSVAEVLHARDPRLCFALAVAPSIPRELVERALASRPLPSLLDLRVTEGRTYEVVRAADVVLAKPGTITVEVALLGTPLVVAGRVHPATALVMRRLLHVSRFAMPNLIAGAPVVPEFLQQEARPQAIAESLLSLLEGPERERQQRALEEVRRQLGEGGAAHRAACIALEMLRGAAAA